MNTRKKLVTLLGTVCMAGSLSASPIPLDVERVHPVPDGFTGYIAFLGTGLYDWNSPHPEVPDCFQMLCDGEYYFDEVMGMTEDEVEQLHQEALDLWIDRFGIDPYAPEWEGRVLARSYYGDPRVNFRAHSMSGVQIPSAGWEIEDGGYILIVTDPDGVTLGGEFAGEHVPAGTVMSRAQYVILARRPDGELLGRIVVDYEAAAPVLFETGPESPLAGNCHILGASFEGVPLPWGTGMAQPSLRIVTMDDGRVKLAYRNQLTFGASDGLGLPFPE